MLKLKIDVRVNGEDWKQIADATASVDVAEQRIDSLGYYASSLASILGDTIAAEVAKHLGLQPPLPEGDDDGGE